MPSNNAKYTQQFNINDLPFIEEIREEYKVRRRKGYSPIEAVEDLKLVYSNETVDIDDGPQFWLGIARAQIAWKELLPAFKDDISQAVIALKGNRYGLNQKQAMKILDQLDDKNNYREPVRRKPVIEKKYLNMQKGDLFGRCFQKGQLSELLNVPITIYIYVIGHEKIGHTFYPIVLIKADVTGKLPSPDNYRNSMNIRSVYPDYVSRNDRDRYVLEFRSLIISGKNPLRENIASLQKWLFLGRMNTKEESDSNEPLCTYSWVEIQSIPQKAAESIIKKGLYEIKESAVLCQRMVEERVYLGLKKGDIFLSSNKDLRNIVLYVADFTESCDNVQYPVVMAGVYNGSRVVRWIRTAPNPDGYFMRNNPEEAQRKMKSYYVLIGKGKNEENDLNTFEKEWSFVQNDNTIFITSAENTEFWNGSIYEKTVDNLAQYFRRCIQIFDKH
ncbi:MAG: hypothetical protein ILP12_03985 [Lachnospiraceae bacterium]|nr:hypothetical protein [Lachnospiraceae bacterium]